MTQKQQPPTNNNNIMSDTQNTTTQPVGRPPLTWSPVKISYAEEYLDDHTQKETADHFGVSVPTLVQILGDTDTPEPAPKSSRMTLYRMRNSAPEVYDELISKALLQYHTTDMNLREASEMVQEVGGCGVSAAIYAMRTHRDYVGKPKARRKRKLSHDEEVLIGDIVRYHISNHTTLEETCETFRGVMDLSTSKLRAFISSHPEYKPNPRGRVAGVHLPTAFLLLSFGYTMERVGALFGVGRERVSQLTRDTSVAKIIRPEYNVAENMNVDHEAVVRALEAVNTAC
jgi:hypothetical protein